MKVVCDAVFFPMTGAVLSNPEVVKLSMWPAKDGDQLLS